MRLKTHFSEIAKKISHQNPFRWTSIRSVIALSFTAVTILSTLIICGVTYGIFSENAERNAASSTEQIMDQVNLNLDNYLQGMMRISDLIQNNLNEKTYNNTADLDSILQVITKIRTDIVTMAIYSNNGQLIISNPSNTYDNTFMASEQDWFQKAVKNPSNFSFLPPHVQRLFEGKRPWVVSLCRGVTFYDKGVINTWVTMVDTNFSVIEQLCKKVSLGKRGYIYIIDKNGNIIYHPQQQIIYAGLKQENIENALKKEEGSYVDDFLGERRIMTIKDIDYTDWRMVGISYVDELAENKSNITYILLSVSLFGVVFGILASLFLSSKISQPIQRLERQMKKVENGDFNISLDVKGEDEVKRLSKSFNIMITKIRQLMGQIISEQEQKRKSELKALQAQINPHFLYNTLDAIVWMNENRNHKGVTTMVTALANFFRISISKGKEIIDIPDEIEHARSYLIIQKIRYKDKFDFDIEVQPEACSYKTLKLILQPIVENAIYHGIHNLQEKGHIKINVSIEENTIRFQVIDNGYGIKPELLKDILNREPKSDYSQGVGLKNVNERIKLCYGDEYGIEMISELEIGTTVNISIPKTGSSTET